MGEPREVLELYGPWFRHPAGRFVDWSELPEGYKRQLRGDEPHMERLRKQIEGAINSVSAENGSNTPDVILAEYLTGCLTAFDRAVNAREKWYGRPEAARPVPPTIAELEAILNDPNPGTVQINPDGSVTTSRQKPAGHETALFGVFEPGADVERNRN